MTTRRPLLLALLVLAFAGPTLAQKKPKLPKPGQAAEILFIGNSYTFYHDLPALVRALGLADQPVRKLTTTMLAPGGCTLQKHWQTTGKQAPKDAIAEQRPDYVVFQEQSTRPFQDPKRMDDFAQKFAKVCRQSKSVPVWYMTWARANAPQQQDSISEQYEKVHKELGGLLAPVGRAFQPLQKAHADLVLHMPDNSHPSPTGSYLAACVLYGTMFGGDVSTFPDKLVLPDEAGKDKVLIELSEQDGKLLRAAAAEALQAHQQGARKQPRKDPNKGK